MKIIGAHAILYSKDADADRAFVRDVLGFPSVDAGGGWLIFGLPASEVALHPSDENDVHELYLMVDDVRGLVRSLGDKGIATTPIHEERWGSIVQVSLPGGGKLGMYEPKHPRPPGARGRGGARSRRSRPTASGKSSGPRRRRSRRARAR